MIERTAFDGHVHLYPQMDPEDFLTSAADNLSHAAPDADAHVLMFAETRRHDAFAALATGELKPSGWTVRALPDDPAAIVAEDGGGRRLTLVAGCQIIAAEGVEILALATARRFPDGDPAGGVLNDLAAAGIPAVLPWGLGKWLGRRGRLIESLAADRSRVLLGDNAGRPRGWPRPAVFGGAKAGAIPVLPGTDPLPVPGSVRQIGRYGFVLDALLDPDRPAVDLAARLMSLGGQPRVFGERRGPLRVVSEQIALRRMRPGEQSA